MSIPYQTPDGYEDFPFFWVYDAGVNGTNLTNGLDYFNQYVYIQGGWGDFFMRRAVGWGNVLNPSGGQFQLRDAQKRNMSSDPININAVGDDFAFPDEVSYPETSLIQFDLYDVLVA